MIDERFEKNKKKRVVYIDPISPDFPIIEKRKALDSNISIKIDSDDELIQIAGEFSIIGKHPKLIKELYACIAVAQHVEKNILITGACDFG